MINIYKHLSVAGLCFALSCCTTPVFAKMAKESSRQQYCGRVRNLVFSRQQDRVVRGVVTVTSSGEAVQFSSKELSEALAVDFWQTNNEIDKINKSTITARFGNFLRNALVKICIFSVEIREQLTDGGVLIKAGYLNEDSTSEHSIRL